MQFKKLCCLLALALIPTVSFAQDVAGYYIDNNNVRHDVSFGKSDFSDISDVKYHSGNEDYQLLMPESVKEYGIGNDFKVVRSLVTYDENATDVSVSAEPLNKVANLFLNVLVEGDATLYSYNLNGSDIFFYSLKGNQNTINQLTFKRYRTSEVSPVYINNTFRNQIFNDLKCTGMEFKNFRNLKYDKSDLVKVFESYNACTKNPSVSYSNKSGNHSKISLSTIGSLFYTGFNLEHNGKKSDTKYDLSYGVGFEAALLSPSNKSAIFVRVDYQKFNSETILHVNYSSHLFNETVETYTYDSSAFEVFAGYRYIFSNHIYVDGAMGVILPGGEIDLVTNFLNAPSSTPAKTAIPTGGSPFFSFGLGYMVKNKLGIEFRLNTPRRIVEGRYNADGKLFSLGLGVRYVIL